MKRNEIKAAADRLREMADFIENLPEIETLAFPGYDMNMFVDTRDDLAAVGRHIGKFEKMSADSYFWLRKKFGDYSRIDFVVARDQVCHRVEKKVIKPARPETILPAEPEREETVVEWECPDSILAPSS